MSPDGRIRPQNVLRRPASVMVTKLVMMTSSLGIIISARKSVKARCLPRKFSRAKAKAASVMTTSIMAVVATVNTSVFRK